MMRYIMLIKEWKSYISNYILNKLINNVLPIISPHYRLVTFSDKLHPVDHCGSYEL